MGGGYVMVVLWCGLDDIGEIDDVGEGVIMVR